MDGLSDMAESTLLPCAAALRVGFQLRPVRSWTRSAYRDCRDRIVAHADVLAGKPVIKVTRCSVELVMDLLAGGYTAD
jgi:hypothetical protein